MSVSVIFEDKRDLLNPERVKAPVADKRDVLTVSMQLSGEITS